jgi:hypothetical protein
LDKAFVRTIGFEVSEIDLFIESHLHLLKKAEDKKENNTETLALAAFFHSFYNALENLFLLIMKTTDEKLPEGRKRHIHLLDAAAITDAHRPAIISETTKNALKPFLGFYTFFRNAPAIEFERNKLAKLADEIFFVWECIRTDLRAFSNIMAPAVVSTITTSSDADRDNEP